MPPTLTAKELKRFVQKLKTATKRATIAGAREGAERATYVLKRKTELAPPASAEAARRGAIGAVSSGAYQRGWQWVKTRTGAAIFNTIPYAGVVELGRHAGRRMPPRDAIVKWAQQRLGLSEAEAKAIAYPIMFNIGERGLRGRLVMHDSMEKILKLTMEAIERCIDAELKKL